MRYRTPAERKSIALEREATRFLNGNNKSSKRKAKRKGKRMKVSRQTQVSVPSRTDPWSLQNVIDVYEGSDGDATKALYERLKEYGPAGIIAENLFRAHKSSARAKVYRGGNGQGSYRGMAYDRKQWSLDNLTKALTDNAEKIALVWGWKEDNKQEFHRQVLYVELPTGQVSFHTGSRGFGPSFEGSWDGVINRGRDRIASYILGVFGAPMKCDEAVKAPMPQVEPFQEALPLGGILIRGPLYYDDGLNHTKPPWEE